LHAVCKNPQRQKQGNGKNDLFEHGCKCLDDKLSHNYTVNIVKN
jgi:hypothetical protein